MRAWKSLLSNNYGIFYFLLLLCRHTDYLSKVIIIIIIIIKIKYILTPQHKK